MLSLKPEVPALWSSTLSGALLSSRPPQREDPIGMFSTFLKAVYKGLPPSYSLLQGKVQNGPHFFRTKFRMDEVSRGSVGLFALLTSQGSVGPFGPQGSTLRSLISLANC